MGDSTETVWLDKEFLTRVLQSVEENKPDLEVVEWKCGPAVPPGTNHLSQLFRVTVDYRVLPTEDTLSTNLIIKAPLPPGGGKDYVDSFNGTEREWRMYNEVLPKMYELKDWRGAAKSFPSPLKDLLVMEDLREQGYKLADRKKQLDFQHCKEFLLNLASFHAISVSLHHQDPELIESVGNDTSFTEKGDDYEMWMSILNGMIKTMEELDQCQQYIEKVRNKIESFYDSVVELFKPSKTLNVLNHGDPWSNNVMFKYNDHGNIVSTKLVDFQGPRYCSFAADIMIFWWSSANEVVREHHREELFEIYRHNLNLNLKELECSERVSKEDFDCEMKNWSPYALRMASVLLAITTGSRYEELLPNALKHMDDFGVFS